jgi:hypothetical protein
VSKIEEISKDKSKDLKISSKNADIYGSFKESLDKFPFILIIGKYDHVLGPRAIFSSIPIKEDDFVRNLLRDALNTKNKFVILNFNQFYSQIFKIEIKDNTARGRKQLYALILLRDAEYPLIPILHFKRIALLFYQIGQETILVDDNNAFKEFFKKVQEIYMKKDELLPLESVNMQIRSGVNTIQGFCQLIQEQIKINSKISIQEINNYTEMMLESCGEITQALEKLFSSKNELK